MCRVTNGVLIGLVLSFAGACAADDPDDVVCERQAPYRLMVTAEAGALPVSTVVHIKHGGGQVDYPIADPPAQSELVFCERDPVEGPDIVELSCVLWMQGAASITIEADGYDPVEERVALDKVDGCIVTQDVALQLVLPVD
jgi:hypothetical protein